MLPYWRLSSFYLFYFAFIGVMAPYWPLFLQSRGFGAFEIGVLMSLLHVMRIFAPNVWGHLADRSGRRMIWVQIGILATLLGFCLVFWLEGFWGMFLMMVLVSFFWSGALPLVEANTLTHLGERSDRYGRIRLWGSIGFILMVIGVGDLLGHQPVSVLPWVILALLFGTVLTARFMPEAVLRHNDAETVPLGQLLRRPKVVALFAAAILMAAAHGPYYTFFTVHLVNTGYSTSAAGWLWALGVILEIGIFLIMPKVFARIRVETVLLVTLMAAVLRFILIGWWVDVTALLLFAQVLHALTFGAYHAAAMALIHRWFRGRVQARGQALYNSIAFGIGGSLGSLYSGAVWDAWGAGVTFSVAAGCAFVAAAVFVVGDRDRVMR